MLASSKRARKKKRPKHRLFFLLCAQPTSQLSFSPVISRAHLQPHPSFLPPPPSLLQNSTTKTMNTGQSIVRLSLHPLPLFYANRFASYRSLDGEHFSSVRSPNSFLSSFLPLSFSLSSPRPLLLDSFLQVLVERTSTFERRLTSDIEWQLGLELRTIGF